jgi:hypothetical protein
MTPKARFLAAAFFAAICCLFASSVAQAAPLSIVNVNAPAINCIFHTTCTVVVTDTPGPFTLPADAGSANLQSRTFPPSVPPAPAAGNMAYVYRVDLTSVKGVLAVNCVTRLQVNFGPVTKLPYLPGGLFDVFVVTSGGLGSVGLASAVQVGSVITFTFSAPVCPGATSFFFGLASKLIVPKPGKARVFFSLGGTAIVPVRNP